MGSMRLEDGTSLQAPVATSLVGWHEVRADQLAGPAIDGPCNEDCACLTLQPIHSHALTPQSTR